MHWGIAGWRSAKAGRRGTAGDRAFVRVYAGRAPLTPLSRCRIRIACKFESYYASFIFIPRGVYTLTSSAALRARFPVTVTLERVQSTGTFPSMRRWSPRYHLIGASTSARTKQQRFSPRT